MASSPFPGPFDAPPSATRSSLFVRIAPLLIGLVLLALVVAFLFTDHKSESHKMVQQVTVFRAPPPPPPPKPEEKPPEPPKLKDEIKLAEPKPLDEPKPAPAEPPPAGPLGVDAQGTGPGDGFGLAGRPGGHDITLGATGGNGNGTGGLGGALFGSTVARFIAQELARDERLHALPYRVDLRVWIAKDGRIERYEFLHGSGDADTDALIRAGLAQLGPLRQAVPATLPQPLRIRVTSSDA